MASRRFHDAYGNLPPPAIVNDQGQPLLSWRVRLLPLLGGQELSQLFRLDQPWNSEHNKLLAHYLPSIYRFGDDAPPTHTSIVRLTGPRTVSPLDRLIRIRDILDGTSNTLFAVLASKEHAVVWTAPNDLAIHPQSAFADTLDWQGNQTTVLMCDGAVLTIGGTLSSEEWFHRGCCDDGH